LRLLLRGIHPRGPYLFNIKWHGTCLVSVHPEMVDFVQAKVAGFRNCSVVYLARIEDETPAWAERCRLRWTLRMWPVEAIMQPAKFMAGGLVIVASSV
jgi:hypothetical protein